MKPKEPFFIAELSGNHNGSFQRAKELVRVAAESGANAIKLQTYSPQTMTLDIDSFSVSQDHPLWGGKRLYELYREAMTPWEWHAELFEQARNLGMLPFSSPFDLSAVDFLETLNCPIYKIASLETSDVDLISYAASKHKKLIISTGASTMEEIKMAVDAASPVNKDLTLLVCTSSYPAKPEDAHVRRILTLREEFKIEVGLSDHTLGLGVSLAAIALGATVIEKHLTLKRSDGGPDAAFSLEPNEFGALVDEGKRVYSALGSSAWAIQDSETESRRLRRSLLIAKPVKKGEVATRENIKALRPNTGGPISDLPRILGNKFVSDYNQGDPATVDCVEG